MTHPPAGGDRGPVESTPLLVPLSHGVLRESPLAAEVLGLVKERPFHAARLAAAALLGRRTAQAQALERHGAGPVGPLAYQEAFVDRLRHERSGGRRLALLTEEAGEAAGQAARELGLFDEVVDAPPLGRRGTGDRLARHFGQAGFDVLAPASVRRRIEPYCREFIPWSPPAAGPPWRVWARALRVNHWIKNVLVFVPVLAGQQFDRPQVVLQAVLAFLAFSFVASAVYLVNDLVDLREDRQHPSKRHRPFAAGALPLAAAPPAVLALLVAGVAASALLPHAFALTLGGYLALTFAYSLRLKGAVLIDVLTLAALYTLRLIAGSAATGISPSVWLLGTSLFFFLSLALVKRYAELHDRISTSGARAVDRLPGRSYQPRDLPVLIALGVGTGCLAVLVLALYVISDEFSRHYTHPFLLWQLCPLVLYWIGRAWIVVARDEMHDDPVVWAVKDQLSRWTVIACVALLILAR